MTTGFESLAPLLAARGIATLDLDLSGYGRSGTTAPEGTRRHARDIQRAFDHLRSALPAPARIALVGASCGGREALRFAQDHDVAAAAILSAALPASLSPRSSLPIFAAVGSRDGAAASSKDIVPGRVNSRLIEYDTALHGTPLLSEYPSLLTEITEWLVGRLRAATPSPRLR